MDEAKVPLGAPPLPVNGERPALPWQSPRGPSSTPTVNNGTAASAHQAGLTEGTHGVHALQQVKGRVHRKLLERLHLSNLHTLHRQQVADAVRKVVQDLITQESVPLNFEERDAV